jgi:hypothetical protein
LVVTRHYLILLLDNYEWGAGAEKGTQSFGISGEKKEDGL